MVNHHAATALPHSVRDGARLIFARTAFDVAFHVKNSARGFGAREQ